MRGLMAMTLVVAMAAPAAAQPKRKHKAGDVKGLARVETVAPRNGFVDDPIVFDGVASRLLWIHSDAAARCELKVLDVAQAFAQIKSIDLAKVTVSRKSGAKRSLSKLFFFPCRTAASTASRRSNWPSARSAASAARWTRLRSP